MTSALDITRSVNPPRAAFLDFPFGHTTGRPHEPVEQLEILRQALAAFEEMTGPGSVKRLPFRWPDEAWKPTAFAGGDERLPRHDTPQWQSDDDRLRAEACGACAPADPGSPG